MVAAPAGARCFPDFPRGGRRPGGAAAGEGATAAPPKISSPGGGAALGLGEDDCSFEGSAPPKISASEDACFVFLAGAGIGDFGGARGTGGSGGRTPRR